VCVCVCVWCSLVSETLSWNSMTRFHSLRNPRHTHTHTHTHTYTHRPNELTYGHKPHNFITNVYQQIPS